MMRFQREVTGVVEVYFGVRVVALERLGPGRQKERIVLAPDREQWRPLCAEVLLELRVERDVAGIIQEQVELDLIIAGPGQQRGVKLVRFRRQQRLVLDAIEILRLGRLWREEVTQRSSILRRWFLPVLLDRVPALAQALLVGVAVLG